MPFNIMLVDRKGRILPTRIAINRDYRTYMIEVSTEVGSEIVTFQKTDQVREGRAVYVNGDNHAVQ